MTRDQQYLANLNIQSVPRLLNRDDLLEASFHIPANGLREETPRYIQKTDCLTSGLSRSKATISPILRTSISFWTSAFVVPGVADKAKIRHGPPTE